MKTEFLDHFLIGQKARTLNLEGLRALAVIYVFNVHALALYLDKDFFLTNKVLIGALKTLQAGHFGVDLFFVLSGYLIYRTLPKAKSLGSFMLKRYHRLWPVVLITTLPEVIGRPPWQIFDNLSLLMIHTPNPENFVMWSLTYEIYFYFFLALWALYLKRIQVFIYGGILITLLTVVPGHFIREPYRFVGFFWGILLAIEENRIHKWIGKFLARAGAPLALGGLLGLQVWWGVFNLESPLPVSWRQPIFFLISQPLFFILIASLLQPATTFEKIFSNRIVRALGNISFSFCVIHNLWGLRLSEQILRGMTDSFLKLSAVYGVGFLLSIVFAGILFLWLEKPYFTRERYFPFPKR